MPSTCPRRRLRRDGPEALGRREGRQAEGHRRRPSDYRDAPARDPAGRFRVLRDTAGAPPDAPERVLHPPAPTLRDRLDPSEATILYGPGGVGKGTVATSWAVGLWKAGRKVAILDYEDHPSEWSRRIHSLGGAEAWESIAHMSPNRAYPPGPRGYAGLAGHPDQIRTELDEAEGAYVIIDSAIMAAPRQARPPQTRARFL